MITPFSLLFYKRGGIFNWLVRKATGQKYGHCSLKLDIHHIFETNLLDKSNIRHIRVSSDDYDVFEYIYELSDEQKEGIVKFIHKEMNVPYDIFSVFSSLFRLLFGTNVKFSSSKRRCEEIIYEAFLSVGIVLVEDKNFLTPENLSKSKWLRKVK